MSYWSNEIAKSIWDIPLGDIVLQEEFPFPRQYRGRAATIRCTTDIPYRERPNPWDVHQCGDAGCTPTVDPLRRIEGVFIVTHCTSSRLEKRVEPTLVRSYRYWNSWMFATERTDATNSMMLFASNDCILLLLYTNMIFVVIIVTIPADATIIVITWILSTTRIVSRQW